MPVSQLAIVDEQVILGENVTIEAYAWIGPNVKIGSYTYIGPGVCIGQDGFGYYRGQTGRWQPKPHDFGVVIGENVDVAANACIDRGSWRDTVIGDGTKVDHLAHVAHNVHVGRNCLLVAHCGLAGSVTVEDEAWIGFGAHVNQRLHVGRYAYVGTGSVVTRDVPAGVVVAGVPARVLRERTPDDA